MPLTNIAIKNAKPSAKPLKLSDSGGLFLLLTPTGRKWWRLKYRIDGKEKLLSLGVYPDVSLTDARDRRDEARKLIANGVDPSENRKAVKAARAERAANSFEAVTREWSTKYAPTWVEGRGDWVLRGFERDVFPVLGGHPIAEITAPQLLSVLRKIESRGALDTAHRIRGRCGQVFRYAVATGRAERDPTADLRGALPPVKVKHLAAVVDPKQVGGLLRACEAYQGSFVVRCALKLAPLVFVRPGELRRAKWADFDLDAGEWRYLVIKTQTPHIVPLSRQAVEILRTLHPLSGSGPYVFPSARGLERPMSDNAILAALRRMGVGKDEMTGHGFRAMARTILDEVLGVRVDLIEHQLAHAVKDPNGRAYNRTTHLPERRKMMQQWADYLDRLRAGADVVPLRGRVA